MDREWNREWIENGIEMRMERGLLGRENKMKRERREAGYLAKRGEIIKPMISISELGDFFFLHAEACHDLPLSCCAGALSCHFGLNKTKQKQKQKQKTKNNKQKTKNKKKE
jgi:hypothetical protein